MCVSREINTRWRRRCWVVLAASLLYSPPETCVFSYVDAFCNPRPCVLETACATSDGGRFCVLNVDSVEFSVLGSSGTGCVAALMSLLVIPSSGQKRPPPWVLGLDAAARGSRKTKTRDQPRLTSLPMARVSLRQSLNFTTRCACPVPEHRASTCVQVCFSKPPPVPINRPLQSSTTVRSVARCCFV